MRVHRVMSRDLRKSVYRVLLRVHQELLLTFLWPHSLPLSYSSDLASCNLFLFTEMKLKLKDRRLTSSMKLSTNEHEVRNTRWKAGFHGAFQQWQSMSLHNETIFKKMVTKCNSSMFFYVYLVSELVIPTHMLYT